MSEIKVSLSTGEILIGNKKCFGVDKDILNYITNLQEEIERLNNIINELEKWLYDKQVDRGDICDFLNFDKEIKVHEVRNKLQELKESKEPKE